MNRSSLVLLIFFGLTHYPNLARSQPARPATSACIAGYAAGESVSRDMHFATYLRANLAVPQLFMNINLQAFSKFVASPIPINTYLATLSEAEFLHLAQTMDRVHAAHGVEVQSQLSPKGPGKVSREDFEAGVDFIFRSNYRQLAIAVQMFEPSLIKEQKIERLKLKSIVENEGVRLAVDRFFNDAQFARPRGELRELAKRLQDRLNGEVMKKANDEYRQSVFKLTESGLSGEKLLDALMMPQHLWNRALEAELIQEFGPKSDSNGKDEAFLHFLFDMDQRFI